MNQLNLLESLLANDAIRVHQEVETWQDAIKVACEPLEKAGVITSKYYEDILESTKKYGPYYIIAKEFAMPHASATEGSVLKNGFSLVTLKKPIVFENGVSVKILMCLAAKDGETHVKVAIPQVVAVFEDESNIDKIAGFTTKEEIIDLIKSVDYTKYLMD
ncbi:PTS sugar transporter subunit IIA [Mycoplasmopsis glycophila]|uniref:Ascorbate-specific PTS system EIIA component n=1 Tax=Mycoplasmopsis glycophila TaxID=171285 RepID=A0A449AVE0_9BACT|nr:PTS sugar transporter subunit IIA [Mycoplasmopsis glycophila]VEU70471.1 ascorbate-specific PTS system enzyme II Ccomponent [Mycoplasmopsis glycophila]